MTKQKVLMNQFTDMQNMNHLDQQSGFSLVEVLVTVIVIAIGSLGIAGMQIAGLKYSSGSYARTQAIILADDMTSRLKGNRSHALNNGGASAYELANFTDIAAFGAGGTDCLEVANCSEAEVANYDLTAWLTEIERALPFGQGRIQVRDTLNAENITERQFVIGLQWRQVANDSKDPASNEDDEIKSFEFRVSI